MTIVVLAASAFLSSSSTSAAERATAYRNATIETAGPAGRIESGTVVVRDGKIEAVGKDAAAPDDAAVIDAKGWTILPGLVDPFHVQRSGGSGGGRVITIGNRTIILPAGGDSGGSRAFVRMSERFVPYEWKSPETLRAGLTALNLTSMGYGQSAILRNDPKRGDEMVLKPDGVLFVTVSNDSASLDVVRSALKAAAAKAKAASTPAPAPAPASTSSDATKSAPAPAPTPAPAPSPPSSDPAARAAQLWQDIHDGKAPLIASAPSAAGIVHLLRALEDYPNVKLTLMASSTAIQEAFDAIKERKVQILARPAIDNRPYTRDRINLPRELHEAGLEFSFLWTTEVSEPRANQETPLLPLSYLVKTGLPRTIAIEAATIRPARLLGLDKTLGSIEAGKAANLLIFDGDPLDAQSRLRQTIVEGRTVYELRP